MNMRRIGVLLSKELWWGPKNFLFIMAVVAPLLITLVVNLLAGTFFSGKPRMGVTDAGQSSFVVQARAMESIILREYDTAEALREATAVGAVDIGLVLPADFDQKVLAGESADLTTYMWGESLPKDRAILATSMGTLFHSITGAESPVVVQMEILGDGENVPWQVRLLPLVVLMTVILGGMLVPATSLVEEKEKHTITAVTTSAVSLEEVFVAKGLLGWLVSLSMGILILVINRAFGTQPLLLVGLLALAALMAAVLGVILGALVKDINSLFATVKGLGILLYAPAFVYMFPSWPQWIGRIFPTYYMISPIVDVTLNGAGWADIWLDVAILVGLIALLIGAAVTIARRARTRPTLLPGLAG